MYATVEKLLEVMFFVRSLLRLYKNGQLSLEEILVTAVRSLVGCETVANQ
jgi:hypothetical protein